MQTIPTLSFGTALKQAVNRVADWHGRSRRSEFWYAVLTVTIVLVIASAIDTYLYSACAFVLGLALLPIQFRRLHDIGRSGWWIGGGYIAQAICTIGIFVYFVCNLKSGTSLLIGLGAWLVIYLIASAVYSVVLLYFYCCDGKPEDNKYGKSPKYVEE